MRVNYLISTDLDGTLLDHHDYSWAAAEPALAHCKTLNVPVILNTSKTQAEVEIISRQLALNSPMIVENGSAILIPVESLANAIPAADTGPKITFDGQYLQVRFGVNRSDILRFIERIRAHKNWQFEGFNDWSVTQIAERTGLSMAAAEAAAEKRYSEPFSWADGDDALREFQLIAESAGLKLMQGGRFYHLQGDTDKAKPLLWLKQNASRLVAGLKSGEQPTLICLGDNHNDVAMLNIADVPVCVRSPVADFPALTTDRPVIQTNGFGPVGWNQTILDILT